MSGKIRILLADDHPLLTRGLKLTIEEWDEFEVVGVANDGQQAVKLSRELSPDMVVIDMQMPDLSGTEVIQQIRQSLPRVRTVALTTFDDVETVTRALDAGCNGFLLKVIEPDKLKFSLLSIADGMNVYDEEAMAQVKKGLNSSRHPEFSPREREILRYVCQGKTNAEIAWVLGLRPGTVKNIISLMLSKTSCISRAQLVQYATTKRLIE